MGLFLSRTDRFNVVDMMVVVRDLNLTLRRAFIFLEDRFSVFLHTVKDQRKRRWFLIVLLFFQILCCSLDCHGAPCCSLCGVQCSNRLVGPHVKIDIFAVLINRNAKIFFYNVVDIIIQLRLPLCHE